MIVCIHCKKLISKAESIKLRMNNYVCKTCVYSRKAILDDFRWKPAELQYQKGELNKKYNNKLKNFIIIGIIITYIIFSIWGWKNIEIISILILILFGWGAVLIILKINLLKKHKMINIKIENIKEKEITMRPKIEKELEPIYAQYYYLPPDWLKRRIEVYRRD